MMLMCCVSANAQIDLGEILKGIGTSSEGVGSGDLISNLTSVFSKDKQASKKSIIGTWTYSEPAIVFQSDNLLAKAGAKLAAGKIEKKLQEQLGKYGISEGALKFTFNEDGTFTEVLGKKTMKGKWEVKNSVLNITYIGVRPISITTQLEGDNLMFVADATKLLNLVQVIGNKSSNANIKTVATLMKSVKGMQAGITLRREKTN